MATVPDLDQSFVATSHKGLTYPFGGVEPGDGAVMNVAPGVGWVRLAMWGPLKHVNCWLLDDGPGGVVLVDTGFNRDDSRAAWKAIAQGPLADTRITRVVARICTPIISGWPGGCADTMTRRC